MAGGTVWMVIAMVYHEGLASGLISSLSVASDIAAGYVLARACIRSVNDFRRILVVMSIPLLVAGSLVMVESITHQLIVIPIVEKYFSTTDSGVTGSKLIDYATRFGLFRGTGAFPHPILAGLCLSSLIPLYALAWIRGWPNVLGRAASFLAFFSVSSTAFLGMAVAFFLLAYNKINKSFPAISWKTLAVTAAFTGTIIQLFSGGGVIGIIARMSFDATTGYYRYILYMYGIKALSSNPLLGIGKNSFELPSWMTSGSIDSYWLNIALRFGYPSIAMLFIGCLNIIYNLFKNTNTYKKYDRETSRGLAISILIFIFGGFSVAFFSGAQVWFALLLGAAASIYTASETPSSTTAS